MYRLALIMRTGMGREVVCLQCNVMVTLCFLGFPVWCLSASVLLCVRVCFFVVCDDSLPFGIQTEADGRG